MKKELGHVAIYDARELGVPRMLLLGLQHLFAMFGATVLVPILVSSYACPCPSRPRCCSRVSARCCSTSAPSSKSPRSWVPPSPSWAASRQSPRWTPASSPA